MYDPVMVQPMRDELTRAGVEEVTTPEAVGEAVGAETCLVFLNSVCGCAAGSARPGLLAALNNDKKPAKIVTAFAGMDKAAVDKARELFGPIPPSSPCATLFKNGEVVYHIPRHQMEGHEASSVTEKFVTAFNEHC